MGKAGHINRRRERYAGSSPDVFPFFRLGGLARSQISARIGARQSNRRGNLSRGVFPYGSVGRYGRGGARWVFGLSQSGDGLSQSGAAA